MSFLLRGISGIGSAVGLGGGGGILSGIGKGVKSVTSGIGSAVGGVFKGIGSIFGGAKRVASTAMGGFKFLTSPIFLMAAVGGTVALIVLTRS